MAKSDALHLLICQLEKSEKRSFRLFANLYEKGEQGANYLQLFDLIAAQKTYNEEKIIKKLGDTAFSKNISNSKYQLYHLILKSLRHQHAHDRVHFRVREMWMDMYLLMEKGLYQQAEKVADKALVMAKEHALFAVFLDFSRVKRVLVRRSDRRYKKDLLAQLAMDAKAEFGKIKDQLDILDDFDKTFITIKERPDIEEAEWDRIHEAYSERLSQIELSGQMLSELLYYYQPLMTYYKQKKKYKEALLKFDGVMELLNQSGTIRKEAPDKLMGFLINYFNKCLPVKALDKMASILSQMREVKPRSRGEAAIFSGYILYCETTQCYVAGKYAEVIALTPQIDSPDINISKPIRWSILVNTGAAMLLARKYEDAIDWLGEISQEPEPELLPLIQFISRVCLIISHHELKNELIVKSYRRSLVFFLRKQDTNLAAALKPSFRELRNYLIAGENQKSRIKAIEGLIKQTEQDFNMSAITLWAEQKLAVLKG
jgi:tetratricopeptide (TPR) repeat protein